LWRFFMGKEIGMLERKQGPLRNHYVAFLHIWKSTGSQNFTRISLAAAILSAFGMIFVRRCGQIYLPTILVQYKLIVCLVFYLQSLQRPWDCRLPPCEPANLES
jgi:hypothetical protein